MKILVVCQHYWPEPFPSTDICEGLVSLGHQVDVITDVPNYPMGYIYEDYRSGKNRRQCHNGVNIRRAFTVGRKNSTLFRILNYYSFSLSSTLLCRRLKESYDVVLAIQSSPVMMVRGGLSYAKKMGKKCVFYTMDLWPASLAAGGISEGSPIYQLFGYVSKKLYRKADRILITSTMFRQYLQQNFSIADSRIGYLPQYASAGFERTAPASEKDTVDLMFAGNVGSAQSLHTLLQAASLLKDIPRLRWHIVGDGSQLQALQTLCSQLMLDNVIFHGRQPADQMPVFYSMADAMLVSLTADPFIGMTLPAKVQSYMAAGKPILAAANGEIPHVICQAQCGFCAPAEDVNAFASAVRQFLACENPQALGQNGRAYYDAHFTRELFLSKLERELQLHAQQ